MLVVFCFVFFTASHATWFLCSVAPVLFLPTLAPTLDLSAECLIADQPHSAGNRRQSDTRIYDFPSLAEVMKLVHISLLLVACRCGSSKEYENSVSGVGKPLYLTPYLVKGNINAARDDSRVGIIGGAPDMESYAGFFTVRQQLNNQLFFWFFPAIVSAQFSSLGVLISCKTHACPLLIKKN